MFGLFKRRSAEVASVSHMPTGVRTYAIGDIHGRLDLLDQLLALIDADDSTRAPADTHLILLGDLIDRGPDSAGVIDRAMRLCAASDRVRVLMGNHEEIFLRSLSDETAALRLLLKIGGAATVLSYGITENILESSTFPELAALLAEHVPDSHRHFLGSLEDRVEMGDYLFVHAGVRPGRPLAEQQAADLRWIRTPFLDSICDHGRMIVHGHTPIHEPVVRSNRIGIDTGAWQTGRLTALGLEGSERWFIATGT